MFFHYGKSKLREGVTRITDGIVNEFLIEGRDRAVLFDTGLDLFDIKKYVAKLTNRELVVATPVFTPTMPTATTTLKRCTWVKKICPPSPPPTCISSWWTTS